MVNPRALLSAAFLFVAALLVVAGPAAPPAQAQTPAADREAEIRQMLKERDQQIKAILGTGGSFTDTQRQKLKTLINGLIDFRAMGRAALGKHWNDLSTEQQTEFINVFSDVVREQSLADLEPYRAPVTYQEVRVEGDEAYVKTTSAQQGERIPVAYDLVYHETSGEWRARDIIVDEVSTVKGYQRSFRSIIRRHGFDALMKSLRKKLKDVQSR